MTHSMIVSDRRDAIRKAIPKVLQQRLDASAGGLREAIQSELATGRRLANDTGALSASLYVQSKLGTDFDERLAEAEQAYTSGNSHWAEPVREALGVDAYSPEHFAARAGAQEGLPPGDIVTVLATMLAIGFWWQMGHQNQFTGRFEQRSWFIGPTIRWAENEWQKYFMGFELAVEAELAGGGP